MRPQLKSALAALIAVASTGLAAAAEPASPEDQEKYQKKLFAQLDADGDGKLTEREYAIAVLYDEFLKYDANKDGKLSKAEYDAQPKTEDNWSKLDIEGKGSVTFEDCLKSKDVIDGLRAEWRQLTSKLNKGKGNVKYITLQDLPDLTP